MTAGKSAAWGSDAGELQCFSHTWQWTAL